MPKYLIISRYCFIQFANEKEARAGFEKGKTLKISGMPVDVLYARIRKGSGYHLSLEIFLMIFFHVC